MDLTRITGPSFIRIVCLFGASRLALLIVGLLSVSLLPSGIGAQPGNLVWYQPVSPPLEIWARWDSEWYLLIAEKGYDAGHDLATLGLSYERTATAGFLPLYPMLIRALAPVFGGLAAGVLISNLCLMMSLVLLGRLVRLEVGEGAGETAALVTSGALLFHPSSLFLSAVYAESLFLCLSIAAFLAARTGRFAPAALLAGLATLTRPFGVLLILPLAWEWWLWCRAGGRQKGLPRRVATGAWLLVVPAALVGFMVFTRSMFGDPFALFHRQEKWRGALSGPWRAFVRWWQSGPTAHGTHGSTVELICALVCIALLVVAARKLRFSYTLYAAAAVVLALGSTLWSFSRLSLTLFPFFVLAGVVWVEGRRCLPTVYAVVGCTLGGLFMALFANWWWAG